GFAVPLLILGDVFGLVLYRQHADWGLIRRLVPGVLVGFALTALLFRFVETGLLGRILGVLISSRSASRCIACDPTREPGLSRGK
ncbi:MAG: hypothetical protein HQ453_09695, partial [Actinobacteria bacterium]|nr:hypothetical protein [Actinomycetota bacterium]